MPTTNHAASSLPTADRGLPMILSNALPIVQSVFAIPAARSSDVRLRAPRKHDEVRPVDIRELRASQVDAVARQEIEWFFTSDATDAASDVARGHIAAWLSELSDADQRTLAFRYDPMPCPPGLEEHWGEAFTLGLSLAADRFRPEGFTRHFLERKASDQLEAAVEEHGPHVLRHIERRADWNVANAIRAYAAVRGRAPSVVPVAADEARS